MEVAEVGVVEEVGKAVERYNGQYRGRVFTCQRCEGYECPLEKLAARFPEEVEDLLDRFDVTWMEVREERYPEEPTFRAGVRFLHGGEEYEAYMEAEQYPKEGRCLVKRFCLERCHDKKLAPLFGA